jgi:hypothetical protein
MAWFDWAASEPLPQSTKIATIWGLLNEGQIYSGQLPKDFPENYFP